MTAVYEMNDEERRIVMLAVAGFELDRDERIAIRPLYMRWFVDSGGQVKLGIDARAAVVSPEAQTDLQWLHRLWTKAVGQPGYVKDEWKDLERRFEQMIARANPRPEMSEPFFGSSAGQKVVLEQIASERRRQDRQWGGASHDDDHDPREWLGFIKEHRERAVKVVGKPDDYRHRLVVIAALAVAAIEALDRSQR